MFAGWTEGSAAGAAVQNNSVIGTSVAKVVQPTATVSSVPVSGPSMNLRILKS